MASTALSIVCLIIEFIVLVFIVLSVGLDVLKLKGEFYKGTSVGCTLSTVYFGNTRVTDCDKLCFGMWGAKQCGAHKPNPLDLPLWGFPTKKVKQLATCAGAFDIVSVAVTLVGFILTILLTCHCMSAVAVVAVYLFAVITIIISIGCLLGIYYYDVLPSLGATLLSIGADFTNQDKLRLKQLFHLYSAAGLIVCGWCLQVINLILMILNACCCSSSSSSSAASKRGDDASSHEPAKEHESDQEL